MGNTCLPPAPPESDMGGDCDLCQDVKPAAAFLAYYSASSHVCDGCGRHAHYCVGCWQKWMRTCQKHGRDPTCPNCRRRLPRRRVRTVLSVPYDDDWFWEGTLRKSLSSSQGESLTQGEVLTEEEDYQLPMTVEDTVIMRFGVWHERRFEEYPSLRSDSSD